MPAVLLKQVSFVYLEHKSDVTVMQACPLSDCLWQKHDMKLFNMCLCYTHDKTTGDENSA